MIRTRNVPGNLRRRLKARAALAGMPLSDYPLDEIRRAAERPTIAELRARLAARPRESPTEPAAIAVRAERDSH